MTKDQIEACEKLAKEHRFRVDKYGYSGYKAGFQAAQTQEMLMLNPLVKELVRVLGMVTCVGSPYDQIINESLALFKEEL